MHTKMNIGHFRPTIAACAQGGYQDRPDTSVYGEKLLIELMSMMFQFPTEAPQA